MAVVPIFNPTQFISAKKLSTHHLSFSTAQLPVKEFPHFHGLPFTKPSCFRCCNPIFHISKSSVITSSVIRLRAFADDHLGSGNDPDTSETWTTTSDDSYATSSTNIHEQASYVSRWVRMIGMDNDPLDREHAIDSLWMFSTGGKECIDEIMKFSGCIYLVVSLLKPGSSSASEAAAGLLRNISALNSYRYLVAEGALEAIIGVLRHSDLSSVIKEECLCTLRNLSVDEKLREKISDSDCLTALIKFIDGEDMEVKEAAAGVLANIALSNSSHGVMVEEGLIPKLAKFLKIDWEGSKILEKEARNILVELARDDYYRILVAEEGLVRVPLVGAAAYGSLKLDTKSWPTLPDGTEIPRDSSTSLGSSASWKFLGLIMDKNFTLDEAITDIVYARETQEFLALNGIIEAEINMESDLQPSTVPQFTLLPCIDGVARLALILELEDVHALERAASAIADASFSEQIRIAFKNSGAVKNLVPLLNHHVDSVRRAAAHALERLSISHVVCESLASQVGIKSLVDVLSQNSGPTIWVEKAMDISIRIFGTHKETDTSSTDFRNKILHSGAVYKLVRILEAESPNLQTKAARILENIAIDESHARAMIDADVSSGLNAVFLQRWNDESSIVEVEEAGVAITAASRLFAKLLTFENFYTNLEFTHYGRILCGILKSGIPLHTKDWVAACLMKLEALGAVTADLQKPIHEEVIVHYTIPRLLEKIENAGSAEEREIAAIELKNIVAEGVVDYSRAVAAHGGIFFLVTLLEEGEEKAQDACLAILYNLGMDMENHTAILAAGAVPILKRIVKSEGVNWLRALDLLRMLPT